jgi:hypothetical protein
MYYDNKTIKIIFIKFYLNNDLNVYKECESSLRLNSKKKIT